MKKTVFLLLTLLSTLHLLAVDVVFRVDMSLHTVSPEGVHIAGSFNGWEPAATLMTNSGNSIYTVVLSLTPASVYEYKFINGNAWGADELVPAECGVPNGSGGYNRQMTAPGTATELEAVCFGLCNACGPQVTLTLQVDMSQQTVSAEGVHVAGTFNNWNSMATAMTGTGNGIYTATVTVLGGSMQEYKYINGNAWSGEEFVPAECGVPNGMGGYNRIQYVAYNNFTREPECFGQCSACAILPHNIQGTVLYNNAAATPIDNVIVSLRQNNLIISTTTTDPNGAFLFTNLFPGTYNFSLSTSKPWGGVDASDANKVLSHAAQQEILTVPVRLKAADVNNSGTINALDAAKIYSRIDGTTSSFAGGDWVFAMTNGADLVVVGNSDVNVNYYGLCMGDVNGSHTPIPSFQCGYQITINHLAGLVAPVNKTVTYGTVTNIPGETAKCWITQNLGADHQAISVDDATEASGGWYWQFNKKQGFKHDGTTRTPNTTWIYPINETSDWIIANDPCSIELNSGWRLPTGTEWSNVDASGGWTNWNGPWNSSLKLHAAGYLHLSDGSLSYRGFSGIYWSSVQIDDAFGLDMNFFSGNSFINSNDKAYGFSVRCIKDSQNPILSSVTTTALTNTATTTATSGGSITSDGGALVTERGVCWSTTANPTIANSKTIDGSGSGSFVSNLTGLLAGTTYYIRAYATNSAGTAYGNELTLTTILFTCGSVFSINHVAGVVAPVNKAVNYGTITNIPGETAKCWITQNLGADHQATSFDDATEASAGWYWQFNRKQGFKHDGTTRTPNTTWIYSINETSDWLTSNDPCSIELGSGWRIPTNTEWTNVDASGGWTSSTGPWNSGLKIHAAGYLDYSGNGFLYNRGFGGYCWSSVQNGANYGWYLYFYSGYSEMGYSNKALGFSVRCLRDN